jgi:DNA-binding transcriptional LysR family regulator
VISTPPGFTSKWLAPRLYRFASASPEIDVRLSSSISNANFTSDGVDVAIRNLPVDAVADSALVIEKLIELFLVPVCSPRLIEMHGRLERPEALKGVPLIHDDTLAGRAQVSTWAEWFKAAGACACSPATAMTGATASPRSSRPSRFQIRTCLIDGEVVVCDERGLAVFDLLRHGRHVKREAHLIAFDLIDLDGRDLVAKPLQLRKAELGRILRGADAGLQICEHIDQPGDVVFAHDCQLGCEGIVGFTQAQGMETHGISPKRTGPAFAQKKTVKSRAGPDGAN